MKLFLSVVGPILVNFGLWSLITVIPMHAVFTLVLSVTSSVLMLWAIVHFRGKADPESRTERAAEGSPVRAIRQPPLEP